MITVSLLAWQLGGLPASANPTGGTVAQGAASFSSSGSTFTINSTTANTFINWQSFNIANGETTIFNEPSSSSIVWNHINDSNPSQILGNLDANGYVILQNQHGFYVGGNAAISAHGLVMTTSPTPAPTLSGGGAWEFDTPPPAVPIINYGRITINGGGQAYLIADNIQNYGTISADQGKIGLYAGQQVLLSTSPDGRGINAKVTLPQGSVDNEGNLIADGGAIAALAKTVNQNGLIQANSVKNVNGTIELVASDSVNLGANSIISAQGDSTGISSGGSVTLKSDNTFSDQAGSAINFAGGTQGGNGGQLEISAPNLDGIQSQIDGHAVSGFLGGAMLIDPTTITLDAATESAYNTMITSGNLSSFAVSANNIVVSSSWTTPSILSLLTLTASSGMTTSGSVGNIGITTAGTLTLNALWTLAGASAPSTLTLSAGNNIILNDGAGIFAGGNWTLDLLAGTSLPTGATPPHISDGTQSDGVYLLGSSFLETQNGNITVTAPNEVQINSDPSTSGNNGIRTMNGGSINVTAQSGDVNTGGNSAGFDFNGNSDTPYYTVDYFVGGISTAAGGNVTITAGGSVTSYLPTGTGLDFSGVTGDAGTGAFGGGDVTITAGRGVYGHYVLANGAGTITSYGTDLVDPGTGTVLSGAVGAASGPNSFALSLIAGNWTVNAPDGSIFLQEARNPNGVFNVQGGSGNHLFDYAADATVNLNAGMGVYLTDSSLPRPINVFGSVDNVQVIYPPELNITAGAGGVNLYGNVTLFPSADQNLSITSGGNLYALPDIYVPYQLLMSDSAQTVWTDTSTFSSTDHGDLSYEPTDPTPVKINISGDMQNLELITTKETQINVAGNMVNCAFSGQNLHANGVTSLNVGGQIYNQSAYTYVGDVAIPSIPSYDLPPGLAASGWDAIFALAKDPTAIANLTVPSYIQPSQYLTYALAHASLFGVTISPNGQLTANGGDQGFVYDAASQRLWFGGPMTSSLLAYALGNNSSGQFTILHLVNGAPVLDSNGHFETDTVNWVSPSQILALYNASQSSPSLNLTQYGYRVGGPGQFDMTAGSISLGDSYGILSAGVYDPQTPFGNRYNNLASITPASADLNIELTGPDQTETEVYQFQDGSTLNILPHSSLDMLTSTIASLGGGNVKVISDNGSVDLGSLFSFNTTKYVGYGVFTTAGGNVTLEAQGDVNIDGSRAATYDGGNVFIESFGGNVDVGSGGATQTGVLLSYEDGGLPGFYQEYVYGSGIVANTLVPAAPAVLAYGEGYVGYPPAGSSVNIAKIPGNITVLTPQGNITSTLGGITQEALDGSTTAGPTIDLEAGTSATVNSSSYLGNTYIGNIDLGQSGVIGGSVTLKATGNITGLIISRQNSTVQTAQNFTGSVLAGGSADVSGGGSVSGVIVGVGGASVSGANVSATVLSQNANVNGAASSTLGTSATATSTSQSAAQQAGNDTKQEVAGNDNGNDDDKKKKKGALIQRVKRVTVILPRKA